MLPTTNAYPEYIIPDLLASWPWHELKIWPWIKKQKTKLMHGSRNSWLAKSPNLFNMLLTPDIADLLASLAVSIQGREHLCISCDLLNLFFAFDEYTDAVNEEETTKIASDVMNAFRNTSSSSSNSKIAEMARQFFERTVALVGSDTEGTHMNHFISDFDAYAKSIIQEANDRVNGHIRSVEEYFILRRNTCGAKPCFSFFGLGLFIPQDVFEHPLIVSLAESAADLIAMTNDLHSYAVEHARGLDGHNVITAIMHQHALDFQGAVFWLSEYASTTISKFLADQKNMPSWGEQVDGGVEEYINRMARCVRGADACSYESKRYYGVKGAQVQKTRRTMLKLRKTGHIIF
ncbi:terpenoid synthase [Pholiota conissans]|uniref:Terpene synthase n=1 Tax=Pholiota conissans TaxID=109636 RepID=A0A9P6CN21_9AGAR|nr:terpenoid synthase [Pholiota conissans]